MRVAKPCPLCGTMSDKVLCADCAEVARANADQMVPAAFALRFTALERALIAAAAARSWLATPEDQRAGITPASVARMALARSIAAFLQLPESFQRRVTIAIVLSECPACGEFCDVSDKGDVTPCACGFTAPPLSEVQ